MLDYNKSALTDHTSMFNHVIDWDDIRIMDKDFDDRSRIVKKAICVRKEGAPMNRHKEAYKL